MQLELVEEVSNEEGGLGRRFEDLEAVESVGLGLQDHFNRIVLCRVLRTIFRSWEKLLLLFFAEIS